MGDRAAQVLVVDDEPDLRELAAITLERAGIGCECASSLSEAMERIRRLRPQICLTDMRLPDGEGLELVRWAQAERPMMPVVVITAYGSVATAVEALKCGAFDFIEKPVDITVLRNVVRNALKVAGPSGEDAPVLVGSSPAMRALDRAIERVARNEAPVHIRGESGVGKELVARRIHALGPRHEGPFVAVNCGALSVELAESELFGYVKGAFTGALKDRSGLFQAANGGTLFLDEVADLPAAAQVKLLRALQERRVRRVGGTQEESVDVRLLSATHQDLRALVEQGRFREDLYYRLNVIEIDVPPLRERIEDLPHLAGAIVARLAAEVGQRPPVLCDEAIEALSRYRFPGNVRELENILQRALVWCEGDRIEASDLHLEPAGQQAPVPSPTQRVDLTALEGGLRDGLEAWLARVEREAIERALDAARWNRTRAARALGLSTRALRYRMEKLGIGEPDEDDLAQTA